MCGLRQVQREHDMVWQEWRVLVRGTARPARGSPSLSVFHLEHQPFPSVTQESIAHLYLLVTAYDLWAFAAVP